MDQPSDHNESQPPSTNNSSPINNASLPLGTGQQASILQVGGQSFLILTPGQVASPLQGLGLNLLPVGAPDASLLQAGGSQAQLLHVGGVQPGISQIDGSKALLNQTGRVPPNLVQIHGLQPAAVQLGSGVHLQTVQATELNFKPSHASIPFATTAQVDGQRSSLAQGGPTVPPQSAALQIPAPKIRGKSVVKDIVQSVLTPAGGAMPPLTQVGRAQPNISQIGGLVSSSGELTPAGGAMPPLTQVGRAQPNISQIGGLVSSSVQVGSTTPMEMVKPETVPLPISKITVHSAKEKTFHPAVVQNTGAMPPLRQPGRFKPNVVQFGGHQSSSAQVSRAVPTQTEFSHAEIKTEPGLENEEIKPLTIQASGHYAETAKVVGFATPTGQSSLFHPSLWNVGGLQSSAVQESAKNSKKNQQSSKKKGWKGQQNLPKYADAACSAYNLVKVKHAHTNTTKKSKSIGTQAKILLKSRSQAVQFPESSYGEPEVPTYQECSTQSEESYWPGQVDFRESSASRPYKVVIVRDPEPASVSLFLSETSRGDGDRAWNMEEVDKLIHGSYEEHPHFDDVAVYFTEDEWACLNDAEKKLYKKVMMDNYWNLMAVGKISVTPPMIAKIERGEEPCIRSLHQADHKQFPDSDSRDDPSSQNVSDEFYNVQSFYERLKQITFPIKLAMSGLTVTRIMSDPSFDEPSQAAQGEDRTRDPGQQCPFKPFLKEKPVINENPFRCFKCERAFKRFGNLLSHFQRGHKNDKDLTCAECGKKFTKLKALLLHFMRHTGERPFACSGCGKTFTSQVCLNNHYGSNAKKKQYECTECGKQFALKHSLIKHEKLHQIDTHNVCLVCGKEFSHKAGLRLHERIHGSHYICPLCGRYFSQRADCEKHMLDHDQTQLFACAECGNAFIYESQLIEHQKLHQADYTDSASLDLLVKVEEDD